MKLAGCAADIASSHPFVLGMTQFADQAILDI